MKADKFKTFLIKNGAQILEPTNEYELVRFKTANGVSIVYRNKRDVLSFTGEAHDAFQAMEKKNAWTSEPRGLKEKREALKIIIQRDGLNCFYCGCETSEANRTIEHLLSVLHGGNNNPANLALACHNCNVAAGSLSIVEKILYRETIRVK
jgi:HNH endonuclease